MVYFLGKGILHHLCLLNCIIEVSTFLLLLPYPKGNFEQRNNAFCSAEIGFTIPVVTSAADLEGAEHLA